MALVLRSFESAREVRECGDHRRVATVECRGRTGIGGQFCDDEDATAQIPCESAREPNSAAVVERRKFSMMPRDWRFDG